MCAHRSASLQAQRGFIQNLILPSLVLLGVVVAGMGYLSNQNQAGMALARTVDTARTQLVQLQAAVNWCYVMYPAGDNGVTAAHRALPATPVDGSWLPVRDVVCPGVPGSTLLEATHEPLGSPGRYLNEWEYRNYTDGVKLRLSVATAGDSMGQGALAQVAARLHESQKTLTGDTLEVLLTR